MSGVVKCRKCHDKGYIRYGWGWFYFDLFCNACDTPRRYDKETMR